MGLPIWRDPDEEKRKELQAKADPTAQGRSPIRRPRPPYARRRQPPQHESTRNSPPRFERSPLHSIGFSGLRESRQAENRTVPPVSTLLESADRRESSSQATEDETRGHPRLRLQQLQDRERELSASISELQSTSRRLEQEATALSENLHLPPQWESWDEAQRSDWMNLGSSSRPGGYFVSAARSRYGWSRPRPRSRYRTGERFAASPRSPERSSRTAEDQSRLDSISSHHPLRNSWRADSPVNGLGDRVRSPTPGDTWEIMRSTITPDATLPSADSSFASAAASLSFASTGTNTTEVDSSSSSANSQDTSRQGDRSTSISSVDPDDLVCDDEEQREHEAELAAAIYDHEMLSTEGQERLAIHRSNYRETGRRFACADEPEPVELGFRLLHEALQTSEGRQRIDGIAHSMHHPEYLDAGLHGRLTHVDGERTPRSTRRTRGANIMDDEPPSPHPEHYSGETRAAVREASDQVHDYFRRFTADSLNHSSSRPTDTRSPPPRYEPLASHPHVDTFTSQDSESRPLGPPSARSDREISDALWSGSETGLEPIRRIVERLAQRDDVPDEWWMSMGLNLSRTRARSRSRSPRRNAVAAGERVRERGVERGGSRL